MKIIMHVTRRLLLCAVLGTFLLVACTEEPLAHAPMAHHHALPAPSGQALPAASIEHIAATLGCPHPSMQVDAAELRQAVCETPRGRYILLTFTTDTGKRTWLDEAQTYGGVYLVGDRRVVIATQPLLEGLRERLGGQIESMHH
ncbi:hypothetical protein [Nonomuraea jabiensis]|uniref:hypothetical protein n=1 Tax=Nonomuraea jabiensis TaxID=882448 RepID=UPI003D712F73